MSVPNAAPAAAPAAPQSNEEAIGQYARGFLSEIDQDTPTDELDPNPQEAQPEEIAEETETPEAETPSPEVPEIPTVEIELDGEKFNIPEKLKGRLMADKDYRQKTMALAESRKQLETLTANASQLAQQAQQLAPYHAQLFQMENRAQQLNQALQSRELAADPVEYNRVQGELAILLHNKDRFAQGLHQQVSQLTQQQTHLRVQQLALDAPKLFEEFPDLQKPENTQKLVQYVQEQGLPSEALEYLNYSAAGTKLAWKAHQYDVMVKEQAASRAKLQEKTKTLPAATQSSRAADGGAKDKQLRESWKRDGGRINSPAFDQLLRSKLRGK
jgi:hypothetical protein